MSFKCCIVILSIRKLSKVSNNIKQFDIFSFNDIYIPVHFTLCVFDPVNKPVFSEMKKVKLVNVCG